MALRMLAACESSGRVRDAFAARGWEAWSADLLDSETPCVQAMYGLSQTAGSGKRVHYKSDVRDLFDPWHFANTARKTTVQNPWLWDLIIAFPPCDHLSLAGARWWKEKQEDGRQKMAADFFMQMYYAPARYVAVENPRGIMSQLLRKPDQVVEPWWFGDPYAKKTCFWIRNADKPSYRVAGTDDALPLLVPDDVVEPVGRVATGGGSWKVDQAAARHAMNAYEDSEGRKNRARVRSRTFPGVARAMADQWGSFVERRIDG